MFRTLIQTLCIITIGFMAFPLGAKVQGAADEEFYRRMINADILTLKERGGKFIVSDPDSAIAYLSVVAARFSPDMSAREKEVCANAMNNLGYLYFYNNNEPVLAYSYLVRGMSVAKELESDETLSYLALNMANVFCTFDESESAVENYRLSMASGMKSKEYGPAITSLSNVLSLLYTTEPAIKDLEKRIPEVALFRKVDLAGMPMYAYTKSLLDGVEASAKGDYAGAEAHFKKSLTQIRTQYTPERFRQMSLSMLARLEFIRMHYDSAISYYQQSLKETDAPDIRAALYSQLQSCYDSLGDKEKSSYYLHRYVTLADTLLRSGQSKALRDIELQASATDFRRKMDRADAERHNLLIVICVILVALAGIAVLGVWLWISRRKLQKANEELYRTARVRTLQSADHGDRNDMLESEASDDADSVLAARLREIMETSPEVYSQAFSVDALARLADAPSRKVSQIINSRFGSNFSTFLQKYRVEEACRRLDDQKRYGQHTIEAVSEGLGFKSRSNFVAVFKKFTGLSPSAYQKIGASRRDNKNNIN